MKKPDIYDDIRVRKSWRCHPKFAMFVIFIVTLFNYIDRSLVSILQESIKEELQLSDTQLGAVTGLSFAIFYAGAALPIARLVDRGHRIRIMAGALGVWSFMTVLTATAFNFITLVFLRIGVAVGESAVAPATHSLISDYFPREYRGRALSAWAVASPLGVMIGIALGGWLEVLVGWRMTFVVVGAAGLLIIPLLLSLVEPVRGAQDAGHDAHVQPRSLCAALLGLWSMRPFRILVLAASFHSFTYAAIVSWMPPFLSRVHELSMQNVGIWSGLLVGVGGTIGAIAGGVVTDLLGRRDPRWYAWAPGLAVLLLLPFGLGHYFSASFAISVAFGFLMILCGFFFLPAINSIAQSMVPSELRGLTAAVLLIVPTIFGLGLGPLMSGAISDLVSADPAHARTSLRYALSLSLMGSFIASILFFVLGRSLAGGIPTIGGPMVNSRAPSAAQERGAPVSGI